MMIEIKNVPVILFDRPTMNGRLYRQDYMCDLTDETVSIYRTPDDVRQLTNIIGLGKEFVTTATGVYCTLVFNQSFTHGVFGSILEIYDKIMNDELWINGSVLANIATINGSDVVNVQGIQSLYLNASFVWGEPVT